MNESQASIARRLSRDPSTISREIARNSGASGYRAFSAGRRASASTSSRRHGMQRLIHENRLRAYVLAGLRKRWSPREIVKCMNMEHPDDMSMRISHETIYQYIYVLPRGMAGWQVPHSLDTHRT